MALETNTLVNGAWTRQTLDVDTVLRHYDQQEKEANVQTVEVEKAPLLGLLSQTVIRSPLAHWILPVQLRNSNANDVAFIGVNFVQIKELRSDGHLWDVVRKENFGARIRNAKVMSLEYEKESSYLNGNVLGTQIKDEGEDCDVDMDLEQEQSNCSAPQPNILSLSPQAIVLQLDTGDSIFLTLRQTRKGFWTFISTQHRVSKSMIKLEAGTHLAINPSSRYMVVGCTEGRFVIYALQSSAEMGKQYVEESPDHRYVQSERHIYIQGVIHKMEFLYPAADDADHVILLVLLVWKGRTRMLLYEWQTGQDLENIRAHSRKGHALEQRHQMPLLVIPLTIKSAFILVSETTMAIVKDILHSSPRIVDFDTVVDEPTRLHHGLAPPLWTAWTRPMRLKDRTDKFDDIYIVREDGLVKNLEVESDDELIGADNNIGIFPSNCGTALASLDYTAYDPTKRGDLLITGGDSCGGGTYLIRAREGPEFRQTIDNWSPTQDFVTTSPYQDHEFENDTTGHNIKTSFPIPDKVYACAGKGSKGEIVEFRHGFEGHIGLQMEFHSPIMDAWVLPTQSVPPGFDGGSDFLLSLGDCSALLQLSSDAGAIHEIDEASTPFDLRHRTIAASYYGAYRLQVTEKSIVIVHGLESHVQEGQQLLGISDPTSACNDSNGVECGTQIGTAIIHEGLVLYTVNYAKETILRVQNPTVSELTLGVQPGPYFDTLPQTLGVFQHRVTSLAICSIKQVSCAVIAQGTGDAIVLTFQPLNGALPQSRNVSTTTNGQVGNFEDFVSMVASSISTTDLILLCGTRNGLVVVLRFDDNLEMKEIMYDRVGATSVMITRDELLDTKELFLVNTDSRLYGFTLLNPPKNNLDSGSKIRRTIDRVWLTDVQDQRRQQPKINSIARLPIYMSAAISSGILLVDGSQLLVTGLNTQAKAVPRHIPIGGSPSRLMYSESLDALIVGATVDGKSTLLFIDPETGVDLSKPYDRLKGAEVPSASGLGNYNERIFRLMEWSYSKDGKTWFYIAVCTSVGRFLMISTEKETSTMSTAAELGSNESTDSGMLVRPKIRYWTRHKWRCESPIYSAIGYSEGIFYCSGTTLHCETLDHAAKRFKSVAQYKLPSAAVNLVYEDGIIYALTSIHSVEILQLVTKEVQGATTSQFVRTHGDQVTRRSLHNRILGRNSPHPLHLVSDRECSVVGLWATHNTRADTLEEVFEAELPSSILRFRYGKCRPIWDSTWPSSTSGSGKERSVLDPANYPEILGLSIDGSLYHFTVLDFPTWKFLRFVVNLALQSPEVCALTWEESDASKLQPATEPKVMMHVDGDILKRCLDKYCLDTLLFINRGDERVNIHNTFRELLEAMHHGSLGENLPMQTLVAQAYADLEYFLRPVL